METKVSESLRAHTHTQIPNIATLWVGFPRKRKLQKSLVSVARCFFHVLALIAYEASLVTVL